MSAGACGGSCPRCRRSPIGGGVAHHGSVAAPPSAPSVRTDAGGVSAERPAALRWRCRRQAYSRRKHDDPRQHHQVTRTRDEAASADSGPRCCRPAPACGRRRPRRARPSSRVIQPPASIARRPLGADRLGDRRALDRHQPAVGQDRRQVRTPARRTSPRRRCAGDAPTAPPARARRWPAARRARPATTWRSGPPRAGRRPGPSASAALSVAVRCIKRAASQPVAPPTCGGVSAAAESKMRCPRRPARASRVLRGDIGDQPHVHGATIAAVAARIVRATSAVGMKRVMRYLLSGRDSCLATGAIGREIPDLRARRALGGVSLHARVRALVDSPRRGLRRFDLGVLSGVGACVTIRASDSVEIHKVPPAGSRHP